MWWLVLHSAISNAPSTEESNTGSAAVNFCREILTPVYLEVQSYCLSHPLGYLKLFMMFSL